MEKIYFKLRYRFITWLPLVLVGMILICYLPKVHEENFCFFISILLFALFCSTLAVTKASKYGFEVGNNTIVLRTPVNVKKYKLSEVEKVNVSFIDRDNRYVVEAEVYFYNKSKIDVLVWDEFSPTLVLFRVRAPLKIDDSNVDDYIQRISQLEKFSVQKK